MLPQPMVLLIAIPLVLVLSAIVYVANGYQIMPVLVTLTLAGILGFVLNRMGLLTIDTSNGMLDISFFERSSAPAPSTIIPAKPMPIEKKEVFFVSGNQFTYDDAPALCAAYDADLATYDQITEAYETGAEWCGYGWTQGGMALFPTQDSTWAQLQKEASIANKTACGRPGVNGGYFDPKTKFGVNCYGVKPNDLGKFKFPIPVPGTDSSGFNQAVDRFKNTLKAYVVDPFNRSGWSEWNLSSHK
jgi:hypothetical protein